MKTILFSFFLSLAANVVGQGDTCLGTKETTLKIEPALLNRLLKREFTKIYDPDAKNGIGNYASFDPNAATADFSGNIVLKNDIISIKANGGISDGIVSLFSNNKWSNNIGLDVQYNLFLTNKLNWNYVSLDAIEFLKYKSGLIEAKCAESVIEFVDSKTKSCYEFQLMEKEILIAGLKLRKDSIAIANYSDKLMRFNQGNQDSLTYYQLKLAESELNFLKDSTALHLKQIECNKLQCDCEFLIKSCDEEITYIRSVQQRRAYKKWKNDQFDNLDLLGFRINWFSFGYGVSNNSFRLYDPTQPFDKQFSSNSFLTQEIRFQYNRYVKSKLESTSYFSLWLKGSIADNFESLTKNDFEEITTDTSSTTVRKNIKKFSAYSGDYKKDLYSLTLGSDYYYFIKGNTMAFHLFPKYSIIQNLQPETSLGIGILMPFRKAGTEKSIVNAELFMNTPNLFKTNGVTESNYFKRSEYGIRFTAPINFN